MFMRRLCLNRKFLQDLSGGVLPNLCRRAKSTGIDSESPLGAAGSKYKVFRDEDSEVVLDVVEERLKYQNLIETESEQRDQFVGLNLQRGVLGVFDIEDLVEVLKRENAQDIFVASMPPEIKYCDYICVATSKSKRHMAAIMQFVRRVYKKKRNSSDLVPTTEGKGGSDWMALDLGNIALHVLSAEARKIYDLETLWSVGPEFDEEFNKEDEVVGILEKYARHLGDLQPAS